MVARALLIAIIGATPVSGTWALADAAESEPPAARATDFSDTKIVPPDPSEKPESGLNVPLDTMGGMQFWTDWVVRGGWRIQRHAMTGHYRLLDVNEVRQGWGNYAFCLQELDRLFPADPTATERPHAVVLLHGLARTRGCWKTMAARLEREGYRVVNFGYASTRGTIGTMPSHSIM